MMAAVAPRNTRRKEDGWAIHPLPAKPDDSPIDHLIFALKNEGIQLLTLKKLFDVLDEGLLEKAARIKPASTYLRRLCFLYEWLTGKDLDLPDTRSGAYVDVIDTRVQYGTLATNSTRFRIRNNLPGSPHFCPLVFRTHRLDGMIELNLESRAREIVANAPKDLVARAAAFLLLSDSKSSFDIEGENPPKDRIARWGSVIGKAGDIDLTIKSLVELQRILIGDDRFVRIGLRNDGGFVGYHDSFGQPVPEHISARPEDLIDLLEGLEQFDFETSALGLHPVLAAACVAFGFVYIHPFEDGNGRLHRFLMHHVLAERTYTPAGLIFPISSAILADIVRYRDVLQSVSRPLLEWIVWSPTEKGNIEVRNDTSDFYRYFDATSHCEYLFSCIERAVEKDLPEELAFLGFRDTFHVRVTEIVDMGERKIDLLLRFLRQNGGVLSKRARSSEFERFTANEASTIEGVYRELFG